MQVLCKYVCGKDMPSSTRCRGETDETKFSQLTIGQSYTVYGVMCLNARVDYLICAENSDPDWLPGDLFEILDSKTPEWAVCYVSQSEKYRALGDAFGVVAIYGYASLVEDFSHYCGILERDVVELVLFHKEKSKIDSHLSNIE